MTVISIQRRRACLGLAAVGGMGGVGNRFAEIVRGPSGSILWQAAVAAVQKMMINPGINRPTTVATVSRRNEVCNIAACRPGFFFPLVFSLLFYSDENMTGIDSSVQIERSVIFRLFSGGLLPHSMRRATSYGCNVSKRR